jgi:hypothetical protein
MNITEAYRYGLQLVKENKLEQARDQFDSIIGYLGHLSVTEGLASSDEIEKVKKGTWLDRCWLALESNGLMYT